jgi:hypothetical protein
MLSVKYKPIMLSVIILNVVMLSVIVLNVVMLSVVAQKNVGRGLPEQVPRHSA